MTVSRLGVIGGSGLYNMNGLEPIESIVLDTPFGAPSGPYRVGRLSGRELIFLARHGDGHLLNPSEINYRANIWGFKQLGVEAILSVSAVGSLRKDIVPGHLVVPDQVIDRTRLRKNTFFEQGIVAHVGFAEPFCPTWRAAFVHAIAECELPLHDRATYVCMEGPAFSTKAESSLYRSWGGDIIGMTNLPEAKLAREAELCYATLALSTDYDCWFEGEEAVSAEKVVAQIRENIANAERVLEKVVMATPSSACACHTALNTAILSDLSKVTPETRTRLSLLLNRFFK